MSVGRAWKRDQNLRVATDFILAVASHEVDLPCIRFRILQKENQACPKRSRCPVAHPNAPVRAHEPIGQYGGILPVASHRLRPECPRPGPYSESTTAEQGETPWQTPDPESPAGKGQSGDRISARPKGEDFQWRENPPM